jgi:hypothetical protein
MFLDSSCLATIDLTGIAAVASAQALHEFLFTLKAGAQQ